jgi:hypothetical protein
MPLIEERGKEKERERDSGFYVAEGCGCYCGGLI